MDGSVDGYAHGTVRLGRRPSGALDVAAVVVVVVLVVAVHPWSLETRVMAVALRVVYSCAEYGWGVWYCDPW